VWKRGALPHSCDGPRLPPGPARRRRPHPPPGSTPHSDDGIGLFTLFFNSAHGRHSLRQIYERVFKQAPIVATMAAVRASLGLPLHAVQVVAGMSLPFAHYHLLQRLLVWPRHPHGGA